MSNNATDTTTSVTTSVGVRIPDDPGLHDRLAEAEAIFDDLDDAGSDDEAASQAGGEGEAAPSQEPSTELEAEATPTEGEQAKAEESQEPAKADEPKERPKNQLKDLDAEFAKARRWQQDLARREQEFEQLREQGVKEVEEARQLVTLFRESPVKAFEALAQNASLSPADALRILQQRYTNDDQPTESEIVRELREVKATLKAREEDDRKRAEESTKAQRMQQLTAAKTQQVDTLLTDLRGHADKFPHLAALLEADEQGVMGQFHGAIDYIFENRLRPGTLEVLAQLDEIEAQNVKRYESVYSKLGVRGATPAGQPDTSQTNGATTPAQARKVNGSAMPRTVHSIDASNTSAARREKTIDERLQEAEAIFRD